jgi:uncharacterized protein YraI
MSITRWASACAVAVLAPLSTTAYSQEAFTSQVANVRAGPDRSYPLVSQLGAGAPVRVEGCLDDWSWCDVSFEDNRGWVYAPFLLYGVQDDRVPLYTYGPSLGIAIVGFSLGTYWDEHYRRRPWYGSRGEWEHRSAPEHHAPTGLPPHATYTPGMHVDRGGHGGAPPSQAARQREPQTHARPAPEQARGAPQGNERAASAPRAAEHAAAPPAAREAPQQARHAPERPQQEAAPKGAEPRGAEPRGAEPRGGEPKGGEPKGGERGGEKQPGEEKR